MGTRFELVLADPPSADVRAAGEEALLEIEECDRRLSLFRSDSLLRHVERHAAHEAVQLDADTFALFEVCDRVWRESNGAFDPTVAPLMTALGFRGEPEQNLERALARVGWQSVELDRTRSTVRLRSPDVRLDLGAVGKGHGLDLAARVLREHGVQRALLHGGTSTAIALGAPPNHDAWQIAIAGTDRIVPLVNRAFSVSAAHGRLAAGHGHVVDPKSGAAPATGMAAVLADSAALADAWSTARLVGPCTLGSDIEDIPIEKETV